MQVGDQLVADLGNLSRFATILADPPWQFQNRTGKVAPEYSGLHRYNTLTTQEIALLRPGRIALHNSHLYLWCPNALIREGLQVMDVWGFEYKTNLIWYKIRKDGGSDGRGVGFYFRNVTELLLFGIKGKARTLPSGRSQTNIILAQKTIHSEKPEEAYTIIEACSPGPYLELFARKKREGWISWGNEVDLPIS